MAEIYLISPPQIKVALPQFAVELEQALATNKVAIFQLRLKDISDDDYKSIAILCKNICQKFDVKFVVNDNIDLAKQINADGVHIGQDDGDYKNARHILGADKIIGVSCYDDLNRASKMAKAGASHVSFGAFYPTTTKTPKSQASLDLITKYKEQNLPAKLCVIGGINASNAKVLAQNGADYICVISSIWQHRSGVKKAVEELHRAIS